VASDGQFSFHRIFPPCWLCRLLLFWSSERLEVAWSGALLPLRYRRRDRMYLPHICPFRSNSFIRRSNPRVGVKLGMDSRSRSCSATGKCTGGAADLGRNRQVMRLPPSAGTAGSCPLRSWAASSKNTVLRWYLWCDLRLDVLCSALPSYPSALRCRAQHQYAPAHRARSASAHPIHRIQAHMSCAKSAASTLRPAIL